VLLTPPSTAYSWPVTKEAVVAGQEGRHGGDLVRLAGALQRRHVADAPFLAALARIVEDLARHLRLHQPGQDGVDAHAGAAEGIGRRLRQAVHRRLAGAVRDGTGIGAQRRGRRQ
jgi:hypothetical protein